MENDEWMSVKEVAAFRKLSERTVLNLIQRGELEARKEGRSWKIKRESAERDSEDLPKDSETISILKAELQEKNDQIRKLQEQMEKVRQDAVDASERHDTILLQMTRQNQLLLEEKSTSWWQRWRGKRDKDVPGG